MPSWRAETTGSEGFMVASSVERSDPRVALQAIRNPLIVLGIAEQRDHVLTDLLRREGRAEPRQEFTDTDAFLLGVGLGCKPAVLGLGDDLSRYQGLYGDAELELFGQPA